MTDAASWGYEPRERLVLRLVDGALRIEFAREIVRRARWLLERPLP